MEWVLWGVVALILAVAAVAGSGRLGSMPDAVRDVPEPQLPPGRLAGDDLRSLPLAIGPRGYSVGQVDALLARLARQLDDDATERLSDLR